MNMMAGYDSWLSSQIMREVERYDAYEEDAEDEEDD